jgi:hypothetical protein
MSRLLRISCVSLLVLFLLTVAACGGTTTTGGEASPTAAASGAPSASPSAGQSDQWKSQLQEAFALEDKNAAVQSKMGARLQAFATRLQNASSLKAIKSTLDLLEQGDGFVLQMKDNSASLVALWDEMAALGIDEAHTTYAGQQKEIAELGVQNSELLHRMFMAEGKAIVQLTKANSEKEANKAMTQLQNAMMRYSVKVSKLGAQINELKQASDEYYKLNVTQ